MSYGLPLIFLEIFIFKIHMTSFLGNLIDFAELVHVELPDEGGQIPVPEEVWDHFLL